MRPVLAVFALGVLAFGSCKKDDDGKSRHDMIVGTWSTYRVGSDDNANGMFDASEQDTVATGDMSTVTFNGDGSGSLVSPLITLPFTWNLGNNDNDITITVPSFDTTTSRILSIDDNYATIIDDISETGTDVTFTTLKKQ